MTTSKLTVVAAAVTATLVVAATAVAATAAAPKVSSVWARPSTTANGAVYLTITGAGTADKLIAVAVPMSVAEMTHLHKTAMDGGGMMTMTPVKSIAVPASGTVKLKPGGYHVMLMGLKKPLKVGTSFPVTLTFAKAGKVKVAAQVRAA